MQNKNQNVAKAQLRLSGVKVGISALRSKGEARQNVQISRESWEKRGESTNFCKDSARRVQRPSELGLCRAQPKMSRRDSTPVAVNKLHVLWRSAFQAHRALRAYPGTSYPVTIATLCSAFQAQMLHGYEQIYKTPGK